MREGWVLGEEGFGLPSEQFKIDSGRIAFDFVEVETIGEFVFADEVDFVLTLAIPPGVHSGIRCRFEELPLKIPFECESGEDVEVAANDLLKLVKPSKFDKILVFVDEAEPESEEAVVDLVVRILLSDVCE